MSSAVGQRTRAMSSDEKRLVALLGVPTFGLALAITTVTTYLPPVAREFTDSTTVIGVIIGGEGLLALWLPLLVGTWSDRLRTRFGGRLPFVMVGGPVMALALVATGLVGSLVAMAAVVLVFFAAYFITYEPYRALYPDAVPDEISGRAQSAQAVWRGAGTGLALVGGGLLLSIARPVPFALAAAILLASLGAFGYALLRRRGIPRAPRSDPKGTRESVRALARLVGDHPSLRAFMFANALWELSLSALKTFVVLYITEGLGYSLQMTSLLIGGVAAVIVVAAAVSGKLGDRFGRARVISVALPFYGVGLLAPLLSDSPWVLVPALPLIAFGGGVVMTLPYALLMPLMPERDRGAVTGFYSLSRGLGAMLGPLLAGVAISLLRGPLSDTEGYGAMWIVSSAAILASIFFLRRMRLEVDDRAALREA